jgi:hypothetical protein
MLDRGSCYSCRREFSPELVRQFEVEIAGSTRSARLCYRCAAEAARDRRFRGRGDLAVAGLADLALAALSVDPLAPDARATDLDLYELVRRQMRSRDGEVRRRFVATILAAGRGEAAA